MDADFTHQPEDIPFFIEHGSKNDVVIGTRFVDPDSLKDWDVFRRTVTYLAHFLTTQLFKMPYDASGAFRLYRLDRIPRETFSLVKARGYDFFFESLLVLFMNGFTIHEIPIFLPARACGHSKMAIRDAACGLWRLFSILYDLKTNRHRYVLSGQDT
jgi:dolichol-phosphate mannosyltransferase